MKQTWRWFGPADTIGMDALLQSGVEGVVSALHHIPNGSVWTAKAIKERQAQIATLPEGGASGLTWDVVESLPVSETIKTQTGDWQAHISAYIESLQNLAACGISVVCYNFMPVLDWTRTALRSPMPHGGSAMRFDLVDFAAFDLHILERDCAADDYDSAIYAKATERFAAMSPAQQRGLQNNIIAGLPGANDAWGLDDIRRLLDDYAQIDAEALRAHLATFLEAVIPTCEALGIRLCCHPDDPPFPLLGLPRIMSSPEHYARIMRAVDSPANGITLCTGSLGVARDIDFVRFIQGWGHRIHFVHLRNTSRDGPSSGDRHSFYEAAHLEGDTDMVAVIRTLLAEEDKRRAAGRLDWQIPMRPDHGQEILDDLTRNSMPGYPLSGRMRGLAELRGIMAALA